MERPGLSSWLCPAPDLILRAFWEWIRRVSYVCLSVSLLCFSNLKEKQVYANSLFEGLCQVSGREGKGGEAGGERQRRPAAVAAGTRDAPENRASSSVREEGWMPPEMHRNHCWGSHLPRKQVTIYLKLFLSPFFFLVQVSQKLVGSKSVKFAFQQKSSTRRWDLDKSSWGKRGRLGLVWNLPETLRVWSTWAGASKRKTLYPPANP